MAKPSAREGIVVITTFASWPKPAEGRVRYVAPCVCGREVEWVCTGHATAPRLEVLCDCRPDDADH